MSNKFLKNIKKYFILLGILIITLLFFDIVVYTQITNDRIKFTEIELKSRAEEFDELIQAHYQNNVQVLEVIDHLIYDIKDQELLEKEVLSIIRDNEFKLLTVISGDRVVHLKDTGELIEFDQERTEQMQAQKEGLTAVVNCELVDTNLIGSVMNSKNRENAKLIVYEETQQFTKLIQFNSKKDHIFGLITSNGEFIAKSEKGLIQDSAHSIYQMKVSLLDRDKVENVLAHRLDFFETFDFASNYYGLYFYPLSYNNWYIYQIIDINDLIHVIILNSIRHISYAAIGILTLSVLILIILIHGFKSSVQYYEKLIYFDELTNLFNLKKSSKEGRKVFDNNQSHSVVLLNIRNFQAVNDMFGSQFADDLLIYIGKILLSLIKADEYCFRDHFDQFILFLNTKDHDEIEQFITKLNICVENFFIRHNYNSNVKLYYGISTNGQSYEEHVRKAIWALKEARVKNLEIVYYELVKKDLELEKEIEASMHQALNNHEFKLYLQPKNNLITNEVIGAEALVRWHEGDRIKYYPDNFIPVFERNGFCNNLDLYMIEQVCQKLKEWQEQGIELIPISVNQNRKLFYQSNYAEQVYKITQQYGISPEYIILEITESMAMTSMEMVRQSIERLHCYGFRVAIDDFGSGYSSLLSVLELNVDEIKLDREFMIKLSNEENHRYFERVIDLLKSLPGRLIIEGIENKSQLDLLVDYGCNYGQGYYYDQPLEITEFEKKYILKKNDK